MSIKSINFQQIEELLPQTQCGLCGYGGCTPYAKAMLEQQEAIDRCLPGGIPTLKALGQLLGQDPAPLLAEMATKAIPPQQAVIRETDCIGCTKCLQACPVDAILGSAKQMHTVIQDECTGCGLCVTPCPVDCIELISIPAPRYQPSLAKQRYEARLLRMQSEEKTLVDPLTAKKAEIQAAILRAKAKKNALAALTPQSKNEKPL